MRTQGASAAGATPLTHAHVSPDAPHSPGVRWFFITFQESDDSQATKVSPTSLIGLPSDCSAIFRGLHLYYQLPGHRFSGRQGQTSLAAFLPTASPAPIPVSVFHTAARLCVTSQYVEWDPAPTLTPPGLRGPLLLTSFLFSQPPPPRPHVWQTPGSPLALGFCSCFLLSLGLVSSPCPFSSGRCQYKY